MPNPREEAHREPHFTVKQVAKDWGLSRDTVRRLFRREPGVIIIARHDHPGKRSYESLRIPESVRLRVLRRLSIPDAGTVVESTNRKLPNILNTAPLDRRAR